MSEKQAKKLRKQLKAVNGFDIKAPADMRIAYKAKKKIVYLDGKDNLGLPTKVAVATERIVVVNAAKIGYRRLKKEMQKRGRV